MSVLYEKRRKSSAEYVNLAQQICDYTIEFLVRLSPRYGRIFIGPVNELAHKVANETEMANSIFPSDYEHMMQRRPHLYEARAALSALDVEMSRIYRVLLDNPQGAFVTSGGKRIDKEDALRRLENLADTLGLLIHDDFAAINGVIESDLKRVSSRTKSADKVLLEVRYLSDRIGETIESAMDTIIKSRG